MIDKLGENKWKKVNSYLSVFKLAIKMGNENTCTCLKKNMDEEKKYELILLNSDRAPPSSSKGLKVQYSKIDIDEASVNNDGYQSLIQKTTTDEIMPLPNQILPLTNQILSQRDFNSEGGK